MSGNLQVFFFSQEIAKSWKYYDSNTCLEEILNENYLLCILKLVFSTHTAIKLHDVNGRSENFCNTDYPMPHPQPLCWDSNMLLIHRFQTPDKLTLFLFTPSATFLSVLGHHKSVTKLPPQTQLLNIFLSFVWWVWWGGFFCCFF